MTQKRMTFDPVIVIGLVGSVALGVVFYVWKDVQAAMATFAGILGTILTVQIEMMLREKHRAEFESRMGALIARLEQYPWMGDVVDKMTQAMVNVESSYPDTPAVGVGKQILHETTGQLAELEAGHFRSPWEDNSITIDLVRKLDREMLATSVPSIDLGWWHSPEGQQYWKLQKEAMERGARIRRIFIYEEWTDDLEAMAREQQAAGVLVGRVRRDRLPSHLAGINGLWDDQVGIELEYSLDGEALKFSFLVARPDLNRIRRQFEHVARMSEGLDGEVEVTV